jgi:hypothetical protein
MKYLIAAVLLISSASANAYMYKVKDLQEYCNVRKSAPTYYQQDARCSGYILGVYDVVGGEPDVCGNEGVTSGKLDEIVRKFLNDNPHMLNEPAATAVWSAIMTAFPCAKE